MCLVYLLDFRRAKEWESRGIGTQENWKVDSIISQGDEEGNISNICCYQFYEWCYYRENKNGFLFNREVLGRVLGPAKGEGNEMA